MVLKGKTMMDSWAAIKKQKTCKWPTESYAYTILADAISIPVTFRQQLLLLLLLVPWMHSIKGLSHM